MDRRNRRLIQFFARVLEHFTRFWIGPNDPISRRINDKHRIVGTLEGGVERSFAFTPHILRALALGNMFGLSSCVPHFARAADQL